MEPQSLKNMHLMTRTNVARLNGKILTFEVPLWTKRYTLA